MSNIIPFDGGTLPAYMKNRNAAALNADLLAHASTGFPSISIKGKVFTIVRDGERKILPNPKDPESAATSIDVVIVKVNKGTSKVFYASGYVEGADAKPDCFSSEGKVPDPSSTIPQATNCATCPQNAWGSKISESGAKLKSCSDSIRIAIAAPDQLNDPMLLRVPAASMRAVGEYGGVLTKRNIAFNAVVTKISFDQAVATPKLLFKAVAGLTEAAIAEATAMVESDVVRNILGVAGFTSEDALPESSAEAAKVITRAAAAPAAKAKSVTPEEVMTAIEAAEVAQEVVAGPAAEPEALKAAPAAKPKPVAKAKPVEIDIDLDDLNFDD